MPRLWDKVDVGGPGECWLWTGAKNKDGYGSVGMGNGKTELAHRAVWLELVGSIPAGKYVLHTCDNPSCVRPDHLWLGTQADNVADCARKGRRNQSRIRKLTPNQRLAIAMAYANGNITQDKLASLYGVSQATISYIVRRS